MLPIRTRRFCCEILKEHHGAGYCNIVGVRVAESVRRKKQAAEIKIFHGKNVEMKTLTQSEKTQFQCVGGKDKVLISPILDWTDKDVWAFIKMFHVKYCNLYNKGFTRLGCLFCPSARDRERERELYPKYYNLLRKAVASIPLKNFKTVDDMLDWWFSGLSEAQWIAVHYHQYKLNI